jgi:hypothetical protein
LVSKDESKVRIQTDELSQQWLVLKELLQGLDTSAAELYNHVCFNDDIPLQELFALIDEHFSIRQQSADLRK